MENTLEFVDKQLTATIDNQKKEIDIYKIIKLPTQFYLNKNIDTILGKEISIDLFLGYTDDEEILPIPKGFVYFTITSLSGNTEYLKTTEYFTNGEIKTQLTNLLPIGSYLLNVEYPSSKYYESTTITIQFLINRRTVKCILDKEYYEQYPGKILNITAQLLDTENNKPISNCIVNYFFNDYEFVTQTNNQGYAQITITMPNIDKEQCVTNLKYPLQIQIDNESYRLISETYIDIYFKKYKTSIIYTSTVSNNQIHIVGDVYGYDDDNKLVNVDYGDIDFNILNFSNAHTPTEVDVNGHFTLDIPVTQTENANVPESNPIMFSAPKLTKIDIDMPNGTTVTRNYVEKHRMKFVATVTTQDQPVPYGMVTFVIMQNYDEIYRYVTELNEYGEAFFFFDVSTVGKYQIQAKYHSIFEYQASESDVKTYEIED